MLSSSDPTLCQSADPRPLRTAGYGPEEESCVYELTYNYGQDKYDNFHGEGYAQVAMSTEVSTPATVPGWLICKSFSNLTNTESDTTTRCSYESA